MVSDKADNSEPFGRTAGIALLVEEVEPDEALDLESV